jgi:hypothetical protein
MVVNTDDINLVQRGQMLKVPPGQEELTIGELVSKIPSAPGAPHVGRVAQGNVHLATLNPTEKRTPIGCSMHMVFDTKPIL